LYIFFIVVFVFLIYYRFFIKSCLVGILRTITFVQVNATSANFNVFIQSFVWKLKASRPVGHPKIRSMDNVMKDIEEIKLVCQLRMTSPSDTHRGEGIWIDHENIPSGVDIQFHAFSICILY
jgi:hypothetical protein